LPNPTLNPIFGQLQEHQPVVSQELLLRQWAAICSVERQPLEMQKLKGLQLQLIERFAPVESL
jgi:hypothetical protein